MTANECVQELSDQATNAFVADVAQSIQQLLEQKHLYQSINVDFARTKRVFKEADRQRQLRASAPGACSSNDSGPNLEELWQQLATGRWMFGFEDVPALPNALLFRLPTIKIACGLCDGVLPPHNPGFRSNHQQPVDFVLQPQDKPVQIVVLPYQCQNCKGEPLLFLVRRDGFKLQIVGRSQFEQVDVPKSVPKEERGFYRDAVISYNSGRGLAALFFFRTFIEQYMRRVTGISDLSIRGDELAEQYHRLLDSTFPPKFRTFRTLYSDLSEKLHSAHEDEELFAESKREIDAHFEMLRLIPIPTAKRASIAN